MSCDEPVALFMRESIIVRDSLILATVDMCAFPKRCELYCGLFNDCLLTVCFSLFLCFLVRVRCRREKFTFAISSADEFLVVIGCR